MSNIAFIPAFIPNEWKHKGIPEAVVEVYKATTGCTNIEFHDFNYSCNCQSYHPNEKVSGEKVGHIVLTNPAMSIFIIEQAFAKMDDSDVNYIWVIKETND